MATEVTIRPAPPRLARDKVLMLLSDGCYHSAHTISNLPGIPPGAWYSALQELIEHGYKLGRRGNSLVLLVDRAHGDVKAPAQELATLLAGIDASRPDFPAGRPSAPDGSDDREVVPTYDEDRPRARERRPAVDEADCLRIGDVDVQLSAKEYVTSTRAILARKSSGKTYLAMVIAEELMRAEISTGVSMPFVVFDPTGVWYGLCAGADGRASSHEILRLGGRHGDYPLEFEQGAAVAEMVVALWPRPVILDVSDMLPEEQHQFFGDFGNKLYTINEKPIHFFIDEADDFCMSSDTEILTREGWMDRTMVREGTIVVGFDKERDACVYEPVLRKIEREHDGPMVSLKTRSLDCLVTDDHRVVLRREQRASGRRRKYPWVFCGAGDIPNQVEIPGPRPVLGKNLDVIGLSDDMIRVIGWVLTDGCIHDRTINDVLCLAQAHKTVKKGVRTARKMIGVLKKLGVNTKRNERTRINDSGSRSRLFEWYLGVDFSNKVYEWLPRPLPLKPDRRIPRSLLLTMSTRQLGVLFDSMMEGDGSTWSGRWKTFTPGLGEGFVDDFQELASMIGVSTTKTSIIIGGKKQWHVCIRSVRTTHYVRKPRKIERYVGVVWDVTVPSGAFVARRNGRVFVTGNCPQSVEAGNKAQRRALGVGDRIVRRARVKGIGVTLITQRPAVISKNVLSQVDGIFLLNLTAPHDLEAADAWMRPAISSSDRQLALEALPSLERGEAFFVQAHKKVGALMKFKTRGKLTFDSSRTPTVDDPEPPVPILSKVPYDVWVTAGKFLGRQKVGDQHQVRPSSEVDEVGGDDGDGGPVSFLDWPQGRDGGGGGQEG